MGRSLDRHRMRGRLTTTPNMLAHWELLQVVISKISRNIAKKDSNRIYSLHWERDGEFASCARQIKYTYRPYDMTQTSVSRMKNVTLLSLKTTTWSSSQWASIFYFAMVFACLFFFGIAKPMLVDRGFVSWSCQIKDNTHGISCFSVRHTVLKRKIGSESR
jgi:hypothetical protein